MEPFRDSLTCTTFLSMSCPMQMTSTMMRKVAANYCCPETITVCVDLFSMPNSTLGPGGCTRPDFGRGRAIEVLKTYPFLIPILRKSISYLIFHAKNVENQYRSLYQKL